MKFKRYVCLSDFVQFSGVAFERFEERPARPQQTTATTTKKQIIGIDEDGIFILRSHELSGHHYLSTVVTPEQ
jgi:hypothetical protein